MLLLRQTGMDQKNYEFDSVTSIELRVYFALVILMGIVEKPTLQSYWSKDESISTPYFGNLHFVNTVTIDNNDPLKKSRPVIHMTANTFRNVYTPMSSICIAESLMKCRGRLHFIQYMRSKRARFGVKLYKLCDSSNGYINNFKIYMGKDKVGDTPASTKVVMDLMTESNL
ncbi:hypothetical protein J437_LFUL007334 [Ladona fulva]|uniref:PiggyBac transposable element-derived protein domain-containing protein n=1 Tax=Ladona fulva TaxID=123851 RepID=A0A8K0KFY7_LADFU|nr:hypothetical protein J437_LFUL007334 [Ladona fulva]